MITNEALIELLNDLVKINNDRITGYEKASSEIADSDIDLKAIFTKMESDSRSNVRELSGLIQKLGGSVSTDTTVPGKIYRTWMDIKSTFTGNDRKSVLSSCEYGEDAAQHAYESALNSDTEIDAESRQLIMSQKTALKESHNIIKKYRDLTEMITQS